MAINSFYAKYNAVYRLMCFVSKIFQYFHFHFPIFASDEIHVTVKS